MTVPEYSHEYVHAGETVRLGVHCAGVAREPRMRWQVGDRRGERGHVDLDRPEPVVRLEADETVRLDGKAMSAIFVPRGIADELHAACEKLGTVVAESNRIAADPAAFPAAIDGFERVGWEPARYVMWYWRDERSPPRAYQIERGELVFRAQEWVEPSSSKYDPVERDDLDTVP